MLHNATQKVFRTANKMQKNQMQLIQPNQHKIDFCDLLYD